MSSDADLEIVATSVAEAIGDYSAYVREVANWLMERRSDSD